MHLITNLHNIFYLSGFQGSSGFILLGKNENHFFTDARYFSSLNNNITQKFKTHLLTPHFDFGKNITETILKEKTITREQEERFTRLFPNATWDWEESPISAQRSIKTEEEIQKIKKAQEFVNKIIEQNFNKLIKEGVTEQELAFELEILLRNQGEHKLSFDPIVAFGPNSAIPHHTPNQTKLTPNTNILLDCGIIRNGYCSDITRNFFFGKPSEEYLQDYQKLLEAQVSTNNFITHNKKVSEIDKYCRKLLGEDLNKLFTHSLGHGVGIEVHESPALSSRSEDSLSLNHVITCEPGIYRDGQYGIRIEDIGVVREDGYEVFSTVSKELIIIPL